MFLDPNSDDFLESVRLGLTGQSNPTIATAAGNAAGGPSTGGAAAAGGGQSTQPQFTNIQAYQGGNQQGTQNLANEVTGQLAGQTQGAQSALDAANQQFQQSVQSGTPNVNQDYLNQVIANPTEASIQANPQWQTLLNAISGTYSGPNASNYQQQFQGATQGVNQLNQNTNLLNSPQGVAQYLQQNQKEPTTAGGNQLNAFLLGNTPEAQSQVQSAVQASQPVSNALASSIAQAPGAISQAQQATTQSQANTKGTIQTAQSDFRTQLADQIAKLQQQYGEQVQGLTGALSTAGPSQAQAGEALTGNTQFQGAVGQGSAQAQQQAARQLAPETAASLQAWMNEPTGPGHPSNVIPMSFALDRSGGTNLSTWSFTGPDGNTYWFVPAGWSAGGGGYASLQAPAAASIGGQPIQMPIDPTHGTSDTPGQGYVFNYNPVSAIGAPGPGSLTGYKPGPGGGQDIKGLIQLASFAATPFIGPEAMAYGGAAAPYLIGAGIAGAAATGNDPFYGATGAIAGMGAGSQIAGALGAGTNDLGYVMPGANAAAGGATGGIAGETGLTAAEAASAGMSPTWAETFGGVSASNQTALAQLAQNGNAAAFNAATKQAGLTGLSMVDVAKIAAPLMVKLALKAAMPEQGGGTKGITIPGVDASGAPLTGTALTQQQLQQMGLTQQQYDQLMSLEAQIAPYHQNVDLSAYLNPQAASAVYNPQTVMTEQQQARYNALANLLGDTGDTFARTSLQQTPSNPIGFNYAGAQQNLQGIQGGIQQQISANQTAQAIAASFGNLGNQKTAAQGFAGVVGGAAVGYAVAGVSGGILGGVLGALSSFL